MRVNYYDANGFFTHWEEAESVPLSATDVALPNVSLKPGEAFHFNGTVWEAIINPAFAGNSQKSKELKAEKIINDAQKQIDALLQPKSNVQHLMEATYDLWVLLNDVVAKTGITLSDGAAAANTRLSDRIGMYGQIQAIRAQRDAALVGLNNE